MSTELNGRKRFVVEIDDFYLTEEKLSEALQELITRDVVAQISASIKENVEKQITKRIEETMKEKLNTVIDAALEDFIQTGTIMDGKTPVNLKEHLRKIFERDHGWSNPNEKMKELAKKFGEECKLQYNNIFATKIVVSMKEQGFLKDDMARILLGDSK